MDKRHTELSPQEQMARRESLYQFITEHPGLPLAEVITRTRKELLLTLEEMSRLTGVSVRVIHSIENQQANPTLATAEKLLKPFGLRMGVFR